MRRARHAGPRWVRPRPRPVTAKHGLASSAASYVQESLSNGILDADDYYRNGIPESKFKLRELTEKTLSAVLEQNSHVRPFDFVQKDLRSVSESIREVIGSDHPVLERIASYFFDVKGKRMRPTVVLLMSRATDVLRPADCLFHKWGDAQQQGSQPLDPSQRRLSEITEMIHTASLLHDDVIDEADSRRGVKSINAIFGNKLAILGGDFLLARASVALARLRDPDVVELLSVVVEHLVKGEIMQMRSEDRLLGKVDNYLTKSYYKTASLISNSCKAVAVLGGHSPAVQEAAFEYGKYFGLAFQVIDDLLDFVGSSENVGKPVHHDLSCGIATLPVLYAAEEFPELKELIARKFKRAGDVDKALGFVERSNSIEHARQLAIKCGESAVAAAMQLPESPARAGLISLVGHVLNRDR